MLADVPEACSKRDARGSAKAKPRGLYQETRHKPRPHQALPPRARHPALLAHSHGRPGDYDRTAETTVLAFLAQYLSGEVVPVKTGRVMQDAGWGISAHAPFARDDTKMGQGQAGPG